MKDLLKIKKERGNTRLFFCDGGYYSGYRFSEISAILFSCRDIKIYQDGMWKWDNNNVHWKIKKSLETKKLKYNKKQPATFPPMRHPITEHQKKKQNKKPNLLNGFFLLMLTILVILLMFLLRPVFIRMIADGYLCRAIQVRNIWIMINSLPDKWSAVKKINE